MRSLRFILFIKVFALTSSLLASVPFYERPPRFNVHFYGGFREDTLKFHIQDERKDQKNHQRHHNDHHRDDHNSCQISCDDPCGCDHKKKHHHKKRERSFSKVRFDDLKMAQIGMNINYSTFCHNYYMRASGDYGKIIRGRAKVDNEFILPSHNQKHHDHDHHDHDRDHHERSQQKGSADRGSVYDFTVGFGWKANSADTRSWVAGILGYSYSSQDVSAKHFRQTRDTLNIVPENTMNNLRASYLTGWSGPWAGLDFSTRVECDVTLFGLAEWHIADFHANGHWKIPGQYNAKFRQHAQGYGFVGNLGIDWAPCDQWAFGIFGTYQQWSTKRGSNKARVCSQLTDDIAKTFPIAKKSRLDRSKWYMYSVSLVTSYRF